MIDFLFNNDTAITGVGHSDQVHQKDIIELHPGHNKFAPHVAVGISNYLNDETPTGELENLIQRAYKRDALKIKALNVNQNGNIDINANY